MKEVVAPRCSPPDDDIEGGSINSIRTLRTDEKELLRRLQQSREDGYFAITANEIIFFGKKQLPCEYQFHALPHPSPSTYLPSSHLPPLSPQISNGSSPFRPLIYNSYLMHDFQSPNSRPHPPPQPRPRDPQSASRAAQYNSTVPSQPYRRAPCPIRWRAGDLIRGPPGEPPPWWGKSHGE